MNGAEYRRAITRLGMTQVQAARFFDVNETTTRRWIADRHPIPKAVSMLLLVMLEHNLDTATVAAMR